MNTLRLILWLCFNAIPAVAQTASPAVGPCATCKAAPAPLIGFGVPVALAAGGVLLGAKLLNRKH
jgi:hypothetical protein